MTGRETEAGEGKGPGSTAGRRQSGCSVPVLQLRSRGWVGQEAGTLAQPEGSSRNCSSWGPATLTYSWGGAGVGNSAGGAPAPAQAPLICPRASEHPFACSLLSLGGCLGGTRINGCVSPRGVSAQPGSEDTRDPNVLPLPRNLLGKAFCSFLFFFESPCFRV